MEDENNIINNEQDLQTIIPFPTIPIWKYIILSIITFGIYDLVWFYKYWKVVAINSKQKISPTFRGYFAWITCFKLFNIIHDNINTIKSKKYLNDNHNEAKFISKYLEDKKGNFNHIIYALIFLIAHISDTAIYRLSINAQLYDKNFNSAGLDILSYIISIISFLVIVRIQFLVNKTNEKFELNNSKDKWTLKTSCWLIFYILGMLIYSVFLPMKFPNHYLTIITGSWLITILAYAIYCNITNFLLNKKK